jgi:putative nucleotidyltransferase with HDIG domain
VHEPVRQDARSTRLAIAAACCDAGLLVVAGLQWDDFRVRSSGLVVLLIAGIALSGVTVVARPGRTSVSGAFLVTLLACGLSSPGVACLSATLGEGIAAVRLRTPRSWVWTNLLGVLVPTLIAANLIRAVAAGHGGTSGFYAATAVAGVVYICLNFGGISVFDRILQGRRTLTIRVFLDYLPSHALTIALALVSAGFYYRIGLVGVGFALVAVFAFSYMAQLLEQSRERARQYAALSWGVLAGLMRSLDVRDSHAARHAAAVARFARDIAAASGFDARDCELAHTAGLLHDIGRFALSDRVAERGRALTDDDWAAIQRHPELGADLLKDLGTYGPVAEIVRTHHERIDGLGYPSGLRGEEIPEIAKIVAVAEVYDTLTANDTYRTRMSSFEALRELRRVAGSQLESRYVEVLAEILGGEGVQYRHADSADFDAELGIERRIGEAAAGTEPEARSAGGA